ncbi:hypothetical protein MY04_0070 [Flammeovirga sp. MY04]|uniref:hypothetical protein n=1 Tax=Flammeovirga sp. MY04 TaxID=1191459 RepID=UPI00130542A4|nr:hypothetical protein [Flammeovirga sp. MY04]ANQ47453.2 hypothetical protein MY04_0070 [Flammeovirga sp. MY04]
MTESGKGDYSFTFDFSQSKDIFNIISAYKDKNDQRIFEPKKYEKPLQLLSRELNTLPGVYNCKTLLDSTHWRLGIRFAFVDIHAFNSALSKINLSKKEEVFIKMKRKKAEWVQNVNWMNIITSQLPNSDESKKLMLQQVDSASYNFHWNLNRNIKTVKSYEIERMGTSELVFEGKIPSIEKAEYITQWNVKFK